jgi:hypothetical protein
VVSLSPFTVHPVEYDNSSLGYSTIYRWIRQFHGTKPITQLEAFPLEYHPERSASRAQFVETGRSFISLMGINHRQYSGFAVHLGVKDEVEKTHVNSRIIVDATSFRENNPKFPLRGHDERVLRTSNSLNTYAAVSAATTVIVHGDLDATGMKESDLVICSHLVYGLVLNEKIWGT